MVIACGGDGTLNEVVNGLAGSTVPLALLPAGTANVLAKELRVPWDVEKAAALVANSEQRRIALGLVAPEAGPKRYFISIGGAGPDGAIVNGVNRALKARAGILAYWVEGFRQLATYKFPKFRVTTGGQSLEVSLLVAGRTKHYGGPFRVTTQADLYGKDFELMVCTTTSRLRYLAYVQMLAAGQLRRAACAHFIRSEAVRCEPCDDSPVWLQV